jgi:Adenylate and Guanylate cyclase catalytic domain
MARGRKLYRLYCLARLWQGPEFRRGCGVVDQVSKRLCDTRYRLFSFHFAILGHCAAPLVQHANDPKLAHTLSRPRYAGLRVQAGSLNRGDGLHLPAAIWFSDVRGFTAMSNHMPLQAVITMLNSVFEVSEAVVRSYGGEVLKLMGDGMSKFELESRMV